MKEIAIQKVNGQPVLHSERDVAIWDSYAENQIIRARLTGFRKPRSVEQLGLFMACCKLVAENTEDVTWNTPDKTKFQVKVALHFVDDSMIAVRPDGTVVFQYRSLSFANLAHAEACRFFERGFEILADKIGTDVDTLVMEAKSKMTRR